MSEDENTNGDFKLWTKDGPVQMEYVTDSGKDRLGILYEDIGPSLEKEDKLVAVASEALAQITPVGAKSYRKSPIACTRSTEMVQGTSRSWT